MHQFNEHHPELEGFSAYFDKELRPLLAIRDKDRKQENFYGKRLRLFIIFSGLLACLVAVLIDQFWDAVLGIIIITGAAAILVPNFLLREVSKFTKQQIVGGICDYVGWTFEEYPSEAPDLKAFGELGLIPDNYRPHPPVNPDTVNKWDKVLGSRSLSDLKQSFLDLKTFATKNQAKDEKAISIQNAANALMTAAGTPSASYEDRITGLAHGVAFSSYDVKLSKNSGKNKLIAFQGQLISMTFHRKFLGRTVVLRDGGRRQKKKMHGMNRVGLVDPVFEDIFEAYGTDQVEARYLLDPAFMQKLINLEKSVFGNNIRFGFMNSQLLIAVETQDRFEAGEMSYSLMDPNRTQRLLNEIGAIYDIVDGVIDR